MDVKGEEYGSEVQKDEVNGEKCKGSKHEKVKSKGTYEFIMIARENGRRDGGERQLRPIDDDETKKGEAKKQRDCGKKLQKDQHSEATVPFSDKRL